MGSFDGKKVLVTGAGGFIGSHLAEHLVREGADVRAMVHYNALGKRGWLDHSSLAGDMEVLAGDITDRDSVRAGVKGCELVFHLGALIAIPYSYQAPRSYVRANIEGTLNVLQAALEEGARRVLHTSTSEVYGTALFVPITEEHPLQGQSPYSASKIGADKMAEAFAASFELEVVTVRPFNTFGPRQSMRAVIPTIISQCLRGNEVRLGAVSPTRDLNFVQNTVEGFCAAALAPEAAGQSINFGSGREISVGDLALLIGRMCGKEVEILCEQERLRPGKSEVERLLACNKKAQALTGWTPRVALEEGLEKTIAWMQENAQHYQAKGYVV
jgi:NAD dependent epimerase/dehydratase